ncbi:MAG: GNAT family N-acetyltransferase [Armatimonadetes bacterium]|nr:GNAT family N-acetyltransferase [Armatimonadota bacterium]
MHTSALELIDLRDHRDEAFLWALYDGLFRRTFRIRGQLEDPSVWIPLLWARPEPPEPLLHIVVAGYHLREPGSRLVRGVVFFEFYQESACGFLTYLAVEPAFRRQGLGRRLVAEAIDRLASDAASMGTPLVGVFSDTTDPRDASREQESMDPWERVKMLARVGAQLVPIPYVQPELMPGQGRLRNMLLVAFPAGAEPLTTLPVRSVRAFLSEFYRACGVNAPEADEDFAAMFAGLDDDVIVLHPLPAS